MQVYDGYTICQLAGMGLQSAWRLKGSDSGVQSLSTAAFTVCSFPPPLRGSKSYRRRQEG